MRDKSDDPEKFTAALSSDSVLGRSADNAASGDAPSSSSSSYGDVRAFDRVDLDDDDDTSDISDSVIFRLGAPTEHFLVSANPTTLVEVNVLSSFALCFSEVPNLLS